MSPRAPRNIDISRAKRHEVPELAAIRRAHRAAQAQKQRMASQEQEKTIELRRQELEQQAALRGSTGEVIRYDLFRENTSDSVAIPKERIFQQPAAPAMAAAQPHQHAQNTQHGVTVPQTPQTQQVPSANGMTGAAGMPRVNPPRSVQTAAFDIPVDEIRRRTTQANVYAQNTLTGQTGAVTGQTAAQRPQAGAQQAQRPQMTAARSMQTAQQQAQHQSVAAWQSELEALARVSNQQKQPAQKKKKNFSAKKIVLCVIAAMFAVVLMVVGGAYLYLSQMFQTTGEGGELTHTEAMTPPELSENQINFLVLGMDYMENDAVERNEDTMLTDMILYCQFDKQAQTLKMLQIPRDIFVSRPEQTGGSAKINALYSFGSDSVNKVQNLADVIYDMFKLPVDYYVTVKMEALTEFVDTFGGGVGIEVYVPKTLSYGGSYLEQGWQTLDGESLEFFLRCRKGPGMERSDYDRLENQKYFYSALFKYVRTMSWQEMVKLMPVCAKYVSTNMPMDTCIALGIQFLSGGIPDENIVMGRLPVYGTQVMYTPGNDVTILPQQETADFLNRYFRPADAPVDASLLNLPTYGDPSQWGGVSEGTMSHVAADGTVEEGAEAIDNETASQAAESTSQQTASSQETQAAA